MKIVVITVTHNGAKWINKHFDSLVNSSIPIKMIVVDNGSTDPTPNTIRKIYPSVNLIELGRNLGFAKANNIGLSKVIKENFDFVFLLNQDAWIEKDTIEKLLSVFKNNPDAGIVSPIHLNGNKSGLDNAFSNYLAYSNTPDYISDLYYGKLRQAYKTNFVNAAAWLISRKCIDKVGVFDTSLFCHYGEDDNYCKRVRYHNFGIYIASQAIICHDRQERSLDRPATFEKKNRNLSIKTYYSDPFLDDSLIDHQIDKLNRNYRRKVIKYILSANFGKLADFNSHYQTEINLFTTIKNSRDSYKFDGLKWID